MFYTIIHLVFGVVVEKIDVKVNLDKLYFGIYLLERFDLKPK